MNGLNAFFGTEQLGAGDKVTLTLTLTLTLIPTLTLTLTRVHLVVGRQARPVSLPREARPGQVPAHTVDPHP